MVLKKIRRREFVRRSVLGAAAGLAVGGFPGCSETRSQARKPNIVFILADDLGYGDLGCYGQTRIQTPNIDRLAAQGVRFTDCYAGSTVCAPSRCCLMTGKHTGHAYVRGNIAVQPMGQLPLPAGETTVADLLKAQGYSTGLVGKWGMGSVGNEGHPNLHGFDYFFGYLCQSHAHNYYPEFLFRNSERVPLPGNKVPDARPNGSGEATERGTYTPDLMIDEALSFIRKNKDNPFFLYFASTIPHANDEADGHGMEIPSDAPYSGRDWPQNEKNFAAMVTRLDSDTGKIVDRLEELGLSGETLVFFTSDNGPHREGGHDPDFFGSRGPLRGIKRDLYEGGVRVPMIARWTGHIEPGRTSAYPWAFWDFPSTVAALTGAAAPAGTDGINLLPEILGRPQPAHPPLYWEFHERGFDQAIRDGQWKAVRHGLTGPIELYDLSADLGETTDVASANPEVAARMEALFTASRTESEKFPVKEP